MTEQTITIDGLLEDFLRDAIAWYDNKETAVAPIGVTKSKLRASLLELLLDLVGQNEISPVLPHGGSVADTRNQLRAELRVKLREMLEDE